MKRHQAEEIVSLVDRMMAKKLREHQPMHARSAHHDDDDEDLAAKLEKALIEYLP